MNPHHPTLLVSLLPRYLHRRERCVVAATCKELLAHITQLSPGSSPRMHVCCERHGTWMPWDGGSKPRGRVEWTISMRYPRQHIPWMYRRHFQDAVWQRTWTAGVSERGQYNGHCKLCEGILPTPTTPGVFHEVGWEVCVRATDANTSKHACVFSGTLNWGGTNTRFARRLPAADDDLDVAMAFGEHAYAVVFTPLLRMEDSPQQRPSCYWDRFRPLARPRPADASYHQGVAVDAVDSHGCSYRARVVGEREDAVRVHFEGWSPANDEWIRRDGGRLYDRGRIVRDDCLWWPSADPDFVPPPPREPEHAVGDVLEVCTTTGKWRPAAVVAVDRVHARLLVVYGKRSFVVVDFPSEFVCVLGTHTRGAVVQRWELRAGVPTGRELQFEFEDMLRPAARDPLLGIHFR